MTFVRNEAKEKAVSEKEWKLGAYTRLSKEDGDKPQSDSIENQQKIINNYIDRIWREADVITLHTPLTQDDHHLINARTIAQMKDGVVIVNTARGALIDSDAFIEAIENGKIGAAGLDVVENEFGLYYYDHKSDILKNRELALLRSFPNVIVSHHMAFYTKNYVETVVKDSMKSCLLYMEGKENPWEVH